MTGYYIFIVVVTLGLLLYYVAIITSDLAALKKAAQTEEENIDIGSHTEEVDEFATQNVVEDPSTGGFNFTKTQPMQEESPSEIAEAEESDVESDAENEKVNQETDDNPSSGEENDEGNEGDSDADDQSEEVTETSEESDEPAEETDDPEDEEESPEETSGVFPVYDFTDEEPKQEQKTFKEDDVFDPSLRQKQYDVKNVFEPSASQEVQSHADMVNTATESITTKSVCLSSSGLLKAVRNHTADRYNIDYKNVQTKY